MQSGIARILTKKQRNTTELVWRMEDKNQTSPQDGNNRKSRDRNHNTKLGKTS